MFHRADKRRAAWLGFALGLSVTLSSPPGLATPAEPDAPDLVAKGQALFEDQRYEDSLQVLSAALLRPSNTREQKLEIYRWLALGYITLGRTDEADSAIRGLFAVAPDYRLPATESPRFRGFFEQAREKWESEGRPGLVVTERPAPKPVSLRHGSPSSSERGRPVDLYVTLEDPDARTARIRLRVRSGSAQPFLTLGTVIERGRAHARIPAAAVTPPLVEYYLEALDRDGTVLASRGDAQAPLRIAVPEGRPGWVLPLAIGGGVLGAAAIVGGLALAGAFATSPSSSGPASASVTVNVGEARLRF